ncbi:tail protein X [Burkholderia sp. FERM BP-3421]|jgi:phage tail protein X|uniref:tail protein X n=1 Tax=Burkholderia sp. FERM BP-3421 TaxID=1494466 RepID=UPI00235FAA38|nr:tail protein X [Burkholderia sp. FERM BP-3421]WDD95941.1 tail protein X [Burkholderia sp. FERM BP-3421]
MIIRSQQGDTVDAMCWRHYGRTRGMVEAVLEHNTGLADHGPMLPIGVAVDMPELAAAQKPVPLLQLFD